MSTHARVLVVDDEPSIRFVLREVLEGAGHRVHDADCGEAALAALAQQPFEIAFFDIRMPAPGGLELLDHVKTLPHEPAVVIITAQSTFENVVEAMKRGALDYLDKPFSNEDVLTLVDKALLNRALKSELNELQRRGGQAEPYGEALVGRCPAMLEVFKSVGRVARSDVSVLITGESGTGKELVARAVHAASARGAGPFITVNAAAIPRELLESELFGHEKGAFTGAVATHPGRFRQAEGGTLFLDEIGDMPVELQAKLLRVLQSGEVTSVGGKHSEKVDVRIIAATHRDLDAAVAAGDFREDLLYRLRVVPLSLPSLRERPEDIPVLAQHFLNRYDEEFGEGGHALAPEAVQALARHGWPGNVRELENAVKRALVMAGGRVLGAGDFAFLSDPAKGEADEAAPSLEELVQSYVQQALGREDAPELHRSLVARVERALIETVLQRTGGNQIKTAALLGINRNTLRKKISELGIDVPGRA